jgi:hypothetical protein
MGGRQLTRWGKGSGEGRITEIGLKNLGDWNRKEQERVAEGISW